MGLVLILSNSCKKQDSTSIPLLSTAPVTKVTATTAVSGGNITSDGGATIIAHGVCWSTNDNPTTSDTKTTGGGGSGQFVSHLSGLTASTSYHVRAYATNSHGTAYGEPVSFNTRSEIVFNPDLTYGTMSDIVGNEYKTIQLGSQIWMAENLKTTKYCNGDLIGTTGKDITAEFTPKYQWAYDGNEGNVTTYGRLYTWYAVTDPRNVCPTGWHVPSNDEWTALITYLGGESDAGDKLKETGTYHWQESNAAATNEKGFTALPGGDRGARESLFYDIGIFGYWWSSTGDPEDESAYGLVVSYNGSGVNKGPYFIKCGFSVRCLKDN